MPDPELTTKTALFVDFDNIYLGLRGTDAAAAAKFATAPDQRLDWFASGAHAFGAGSSEPRRRAILVRRCYLI
jgi:hypothetical protein